MGEWGMLSHPQNMELLSWTLGSSLEGDGGEESRPAVYLGRHACESEHPEKLIPLLLPLTPHINKDSLPWMPDRGRA